MKACDRCEAVFYCGRACQKAAWKVHKKTCSPIAEAASSFQARAEQAGESQILCTVTPCDLTGLFALNTVYADAKGTGVATIHMRIGYGVQNVLHLQPGSMLPEANALPLEQVERLFWTDNQRIISSCNSRRLQLVWP